MEGKDSSIRLVLGGLQDLETTISGRLIADPGSVSSQVAKVAESLAQLAEETRLMDNAMIRPIPLELLSHLDQPKDNNPDLYQRTLVEKALESAERTKARVAYLHAMESEISEQLSLEP